MVSAKRFIFSFPKKEMGTERESGSKGSWGFSGLEVLQGQGMAEPAHHWSGQLAELGLWAGASLLFLCIGQFLDLFLK